VSGAEVLAALQHGFQPGKIASVGIGETDRERDIVLENNIFSSNSESIQELEVINQPAAHAGKKTPVGIRLYPDVNAQNHLYITTRFEENKFGINPWELDNMLDVIKQLRHVELTGIH
jgi:diaminopimelate decarboxylase